MDRYELRRLDYSLSDDQVDSAGRVQAVLQDPVFDRDGPRRRAHRIRQEPVGTVVRDGRDHAWRCRSRVGGDGATLVDLTLVAEEVGRSLAPVPWIDHVCAARLLGAAGGSDTAGVINGEQIAAFDPQIDSGRGRRLISTGSIADHIIVRDGDEVVRLTFDTRPTRVDNIGRLPMAWVDPAAADSRTALADGADALGGLPTGTG